MKILIACEFSGIVRRAFADRGHATWSCDLLPSLDDSPRHIIGDVLSVLDDGWDMVVAHPPCTALCVSGNRWYAGTKARDDALDFFKIFVGCAPKVCIENPVGVVSRWRKPTQYIQPWQFGHGETKKTGLWLENLPPLVPTKVVPGRDQRIWRMPPSPDRGYLRSITYQGVADAMAEQWG